MKTIENHHLIINIRTNDVGQFGCNLSNGYGETLVIIPPRYNTKQAACKRAMLILIENNLQTIISE